MTRQALHTSLPQQALALCLSALVTASVLNGLLGLAGPDANALMAQQQQRAPQAAAVALRLPQA